ncbi:MAG TPA: hypothetical protein VN039_10450 [Nitrospira sp.]|nr:hypothetical protein [Nitrospira sp.]
MGWLGWQLDKRRRERQNVAFFKTLLATPATGAFKLPANARLAFQSVAGAAQGTAAATLVGASTRNIACPTALVAGDYFVFDNAEIGTTITPSAGWNVLLDVGLGVFKKIGAG